jgi:phosphoribosylamine--glycine ligase
LQNDLLELLMACVDGTLDKQQLNWKSGSAVCVIMASGGYPGSYQKGKIISGITDAEMDTNVKIFHAGTALNGDKFITNGGRGWGLPLMGETLRKPATRYAAVDKI